MQLCWIAPTKMEGPDSFFTAVLYIRSNSIEVNRINQVREENQTQNVFIQILEFELARC